MTCFHRFSLARVTAAVGDGSYGQLGYGNTNTIGDGAGEMPPADVNVGATVIQLTAGYYQTCALLSGGIVRCWGE